MQSFNPSKYRNPMVKKTVARTAPGKKQQFMRVKQRLDPQKSVKEPKRNPTMMPKSYPLVICYIAMENHDFL